jgi:hypothetical protein
MHAASFVSSFNYYVRTCIFVLLLFIIWSSNTCLAIYGNEPMYCTYWRWSNKASACVGRVVVFFLVERCTVFSTSCAHSCGSPHSNRSSHFHTSLLPCVSLVDLSTVHAWLTDLPRVSKAGFNHTMRSPVSARKQIGSVYRWNWSFPRGYKFVATVLRWEPDRFRYRIGTRFPHVPLTLCWGIQKNPSPSKRRG